MSKTKSKFPAWLRKKIEILPEFYSTRKTLAEYKLNTVCESANCPNIFECYSRCTSTVMILGKNCTRACLFCRVDKGDLPDMVDENEPERIAEWVEKTGQKYLVITSVTRDDLADGGAGHFDRVVRCVKDKSPKTVIELLVPDFEGNESAIKTVAESPCEIIGHNVETVPRLYASVRPQASYERSIELLEKIKKISLNKMIKSSMILGIGEKPEEVVEVIRDLADIKCDVLVLGQYLQSGKKQIAVDRFVTPEEFDYLKSAALRLGIPKVYSGPWYRSSYRAEEMI